MITVEFKGVPSPIRFWRQWPGDSPEQGHRDSACCSIPTKVYHHSPTGIEWGYGGRGPADAALNVLHKFLPVGCDGCKPVKLWGGKCSRVAFDLHQDFKREWIQTLPQDGGEMAAKAVEEWIYDKLVGWLDYWNKKNGFNPPEEDDI